MLLVAQAFFHIHVYRRVRIMWQGCCCRQLAPCPVPQLSPSTSPLQLSLMSIVPSLPPLCFSSFPFLPCRSIIISFSIPLYFFLFSIVHVYISHGIACTVRHLRHDDRDE